MTLFLALYVCVVRFPQRRVCFLNEVRFLICFCITGVFRKQKRLDWNTTQNLPLLIEDRVGLERKPTHPGMFSTENIFISNQGTSGQSPKVFVFLFGADERPSESQNECQHAQAHWPPRDLTLLPVHEQPLLQFPASIAQCRKRNRP